MALCLRHHRLAERMTAEAPASATATRRATPGSARASSKPHRSAYGERANEGACRDRRRAGGTRRRLRGSSSNDESKTTTAATGPSGVLAFYAFPAEHWPKLRSTNPLERFNREIGRRTHVVGIFPDDSSLIGSSRCSPSKPTMNGSSDAATSADSRWRLSMRPGLRTPSLPNAPEEVTELVTA